MASNSLRIALIAHDGQKRDMREWAVWNKKLLSRFRIYATQSTGEMVAEATGLPVELLLSGPFGGDAQVGAMIARRELDVVVFFWDPLSTQPHAADVQSLIRLAVLHGVAIACNRRTADLVISSPLLEETSTDVVKASVTTPPGERAR
jgi:methylglyoxal synthase